MEKVNYSPVAFLGKNDAQKPSKEENVEVPKQKKNGKKLIALGAAALATAAVAGIAIYKHKANAATIQQGIQETTEAMQKSFPDGTKIFSTNDFKQNFKFEDGIAMFEGNPFEGQVGVFNGDTVHKLSFKDGKIEKSIEMQATQEGFRPISEKLYNDLHGSFVGHYPYEKNCCSGAYERNDEAEITTHILKFDGATSTMKDFPNEGYISVNAEKKADGTTLVQKRVFSSDEGRYVENSKYKIIGEGKDAKKVLVEDLLNSKKEA